MNRKRILAIGKLVLLFGTPLALLFGLFGSGVYCGVQHRVGILKFERDWLGLEVEVPAEASAQGSEDPPADDDKSDDDESDDESESAEAEEPKTAEPSKTPEPVEPEPEPTVPPPVVEPPPKAPADPVEPSGVGRIPAPLPPAATRVDPLPAADQQRLEKPTSVAVRVLVDRAFVDANPEWIDTVQRTVSRASEIYREQFGIELSLWSVGRWEVAAQGMSTNDLLDDLRARPRGGAQVTVGLTSRAYDGEAIQTGPEADDAPFNGAYTVVYATPGHQLSHLRSLLHEVARLLGAQPVSDPEAAAWKAGSWMSFAPAAENQAAWIDADNRRRVLAGKDRPFSPQPVEPAAEPSQEEQP